MAKIQIGISLIMVLFFSCQEKEENTFWNDGEEYFEVTEVFDEGRFPNVVIAKDGSVVTTWSNKKYEVRRSEDGGSSWGPKITVADPGFQGGA